MNDEDKKLLTKYLGERWRDKTVEDIEERYESIMSKVEIFDRHIEDKSHEDIADFYQNIFDSMQSVSESLLRAVRGLS